MAKACVFWLNSLPLQSSFDNELSPRTIVTGQKLDFKRHCCFQFGEYVQTHEEHDNSMSPRTVGALALHPTGNAQGGFRFMSLSTGRVLNRLCTTALPMPDNVVDQVHQMAQQQKATPGLLFGDCNMNSLNDQDIGESSDDEDNEEYVPDDEDANEGQNGGDEDVSHEYDHDETGSIEEEYDEPTDNNAINVADDGMNTHEEVNLGRLDGGAGLDEPENPGVDDVANNENTEVNGIENLGVDQIDNEIINYEVERSGRR